MADDMPISTPSRGQAWSHYRRILNRQSQWLFLMAHRLDDAYSGDPGDDETSCERAVKQFIRQGF